MNYTILIPKVVQKQLDALPNDVYERVAVKREVLQLKIKNEQFKMAGEGRISEVSNPDTTWIYR